MHGRCFFSCAFIAVALYTRDATSAETPPNTVTCNKKQETEAAEQTATVDEKTLQASFTCAEAFIHGIVPSIDASPITKCCKDVTCAGGTGVEISEAVNVEGKAVKSGNTVTVTLAKVPDESRGKKIFYKCKQDEQNLCVVTLKLPDTLPEHECAVDRTVKLELSSSKKTAEFKCNGELEDNPTEVSTGDACTDKPKEQSFVNLAGQNSAAKTYTLNLVQQPATPAKLCYRCLYKNVPTVENPSQGAQRACNVLVSIAAKSPEGSSSTTATTTSVNSANPARTAPGFVTTMALVVRAVVAN